MWGVGGEYAARRFLLFFYFPCSADHERDWPPCKVVFRVGNQYAECEEPLGGCSEGLDAFRFFFLKHCLGPVAPVAQRYHVTSDTLGREFDPGKRDFSH